MAVIDMQRRKFIQFTGLGALLPFLPAQLRAEYEGRAVVPHDLGDPGCSPGPNFLPDVDIELTAKPATVPILPGRETRVWKFEGRVLQGPQHSVRQLPNSYLGPLLQLEKGQRVRIRFRNQLPEDCIVHWHGVHVPYAMDGHPQFAIGPDKTYVYEFQVVNRAGTCWYHPHTHMLTGKQVYYGLAGLFLINDPEEKALDFPAGDYDLPLVIQDRSFDSDNQFHYPQHMGHMPMHDSGGILGDRILVNGQPNLELPVATRPYRLRLLNGSHSRIYKLAWSNGKPLTIIGTDGGLLEKPVTRPYVMLAPGERVELWADFSGMAVGSELTLKSLAFAISEGHGGMGGMMGGGMGHHGMMGGMRHGGGMGMHGMMMGMSELPLGSDYPLFKVRVARIENITQRLPERLVTITRHQEREAANRDKPRRIQLAWRHMDWTLNGRTWEPNDVADFERVKVNTLQLIQFDNGYESGGMGMHGMMAMPHPMHLHGQQFQIVRREVDPDAQDDYRTVSQGFVDDGWKDTVLVMPGERVTILKRFDHCKGLFMYHCHNLVHEDMGMMREISVE